MLNSNKVASVRKEGILEMNQLQKDTKRELQVQGRQFHYFHIEALNEFGYQVETLPFSIRILLESVLRQMDDYTITREHAELLAGWKAKQKQTAEIPFKPSRVILQDFTGVPAVVDLASMRAAIAEYVHAQKGKDASMTEDQREAEVERLVQLINPNVQVDLVIDHSLQVDYAGNPSAMDENARLEFERNQERYEFLNWAQQSFQNFSVVPPATGIVHQVNLEYLAPVVMEKELNGERILFPDSLVGTDSHTTMINGLGVLGWGVGGIEAEAGMLGQASFLTLPEVIGVKLTGKLPIGATATDLALKLTQVLRSYGVVDKFIEYFGEGVKSLSLADRATIANMAPEYGATCGYFPVDTETLHYLKLTGRSKDQIELVETYYKKNRLFQDYQTEADYTDIIILDLSTLKPSLSGPKRPQDLLLLEDIKTAFDQAVISPAGNSGYGCAEDELQKEVLVTTKNGQEFNLKTGSVVIAAITSCTNTSNPSVMLGAGLLAKKAVEKGLRVPPYVKTSLAPGSKVVSGYLEQAGLQPYLDQLGFQVVGYGCATCIGNSGPLMEEIEEAIAREDLLCASVLSGNRNFEGRIHQKVKANYLASPPLVVAYALAGTVRINLEKEPIGYDQNQNSVYLKDIWPSAEEITEAVSTFVKPELFQEKYKNVYFSNQKWNGIDAVKSSLYKFKETSTYIKNPPYFKDFSMSKKELKSLEGLRVLAVFGDSITTDHISPAGGFSIKTPAGKYLLDMGIPKEDFNSYGSRRGNHEIMMRGTFANVRIRNKMADGIEGGFTKTPDTMEVQDIYTASMNYAKQGTPLMILAGKDYGMGSSRDWAAKGPKLLGVQVVLAESYERIHRSNLVMMGILPLQFLAGESAMTYDLNGSEEFMISIGKEKSPQMLVKVEAFEGASKKAEFSAILRFDSQIDFDYYEHGGILPMVIREKLS